MMSDMGAAKTGRDVPREATAAEDICALAANVQSHASSVLAKLDGKLIPVVYQASPEAIEKGKERKAYPPLFSDLYERLIQIDSCLYGVDDIINRVAM
jgi:hypothetical protein